MQCLQRDSPVRCRAMVCSQPQSLPTRPETKKGSSFMVLKPISVQDQSMEELYKIVHELTQCQCGACYDCLKRAGIIG